MEEALIKRLLATAAIGAIFGDRIFWQRRPSAVGSLPALTLNVVGEPREYTHDGPDDWQQIRIQCDTRGLKYLDAKRGMRVVLSELELEHERLGVHFDEGHKVTGADAPTETLGGGTEVFRITMDIMVPFRLMA